MADENTQTTHTEEAPQATQAADAENTQATAQQSGEKPARRKKVLGRGGRRKSGGGRKGSSERYKPEFEQKIVDIRRVSRVVAGGRRFSFRVTVVIGNRKGKVGVGLGKGMDTAIAIEKAVKQAKKSMVEVNTTENMSVPHEVHAKYGASRVEIRPAPGKGLVAGSSVRTVLDLAGITDVSAKMHSRTKNKLNNARVAVDALKRIEHEHV